MIPNSIKTIRLLRLSSSMLWLALRQLPLGTYRFPRRPGRPTSEWTLAGQCPAKCISPAPSNNPPARAPGSCSDFLPVTSGIRLLLKSFKHNWTSNMCFSRSCSSLFRTSFAKAYSIHPTNAQNAKKKDNRNAAKMERFVFSSLVGRDTWETGAEKERIDDGCISLDRVECSIRSKVNNVASDYLWDVICSWPTGENRLAWNSTQSC